MSPDNQSCETTQSPRAARPQCTCDERCRARYNLPRVSLLLQSDRPVRDWRSTSSTNCDAVLSNVLTPPTPAARLPCDNPASHVPTNGSSGRVETVRRYPGRRQSPKFRDRGPASWSYHCFRIDTVNALRFLIQRLQTHCPPCKIKVDAKVSQEITPENSALREPGSLVHRLHVEHGRVDLLHLRQAETQPRQLQQLHVVRYTRRSEHAHLRRLKQFEQLFLLREFF